MGVKERLSQELNEEQAKAVYAFGPKTLVVAGAGSGKTRVLTYGLSYLLEEKKFLPSQIALLTFTRKAAETMRERSQEVTGQDLSELYCGTFHAVGALLLRQNGYEFSVIDETQVQMMIAQIGAELLEEREMEGEVQLAAELLATWFSQIKEEEVELEELLVDAPERYRDYAGLIDEIREKFEDRKDEEKLYDYADLLVQTRSLLQHSNVSQQFRAVLVDEVQDLNKMQRDILNLLCREGAWLIEVGDAEQSIYGFRGASYESMLAQAEDPTVVIQKLETNYRSSKEIVKLSQELIPPSKLALSIRAYRQTGESPSLLRPHNQKEEANVIAKWAKDKEQQGVALEEMAILARTHSHLAAAEKALLEVGLPVAFLGKKKGAVEEIKSYLISLLQLTVNPYSRLSWQRTLPLLQIDVEEQHATLLSLLDAENPFELALSLTESDYGKEVLNMLVDGVASNALWRRLCLGPIGQLIDSSLEPTQVAGVLQELLELGQSPEEGFVYLNALALADTVESSIPAIRLGTIHAAKGLEWKHVFIMRCSYDAFPSRMAVHEGALDEERRLFYVAVTRAEDSLVVCEAPWLGGEERHSCDFLYSGNIREHFTES